jgi:hypothetical protein
MKIKRNMKNFFKISAFSGLVFFTGLTFYYLWQWEEVPELESLPRAQWSAHTKTSPTKIRSSVARKIEKNQYKLPELKTPLETKIIGPYSSSTQMLNQPSEKWKELAIDRLMHHQGVNTKIYIHSIESRIKVFQKKQQPEKTFGRYEEIAVVTIINAQGIRGDFKALIDSETGEITKTWDRTFEQKGIKPVIGQKLSPAGQIKN